jgi:predicted ester cyclase
MSTANRELVQRWFEEVWNKQSEDAIDEMFAPGGKSYGFPEPSSILIGPDKFKETHRFFLGAFPDIHITVHDVISEGDRVAVTWVANMTHLGDSLGFAPTLQKVSLEGCSVLVVSNGQIHEGKNYMELRALINRLKASAALSASQNEASFA